MSISEQDVDLVLKGFREAPGMASFSAMDERINLPTFLGIGAPKAGTTWLHDVLASHPRIWVPRRHELHYFDRNFERGEGWYGGFFPRPSERDRYAAVGEVTPHYLYDARCAERISAVPSVRKLILLLRDPVDRAWSHYWFRVRIENYEGSFEEFLEDRPEARTWGLYGRHLQKYLSLFPEENLLVLVYEKVFEDLPEALERLAAFLEVDAGGFSADVARRRINPRHIPRFRWAYAAAFSVGRWLVRHDLHGGVAFAKKLGVTSLFGRDEDSAKGSSMSAETREALVSFFADDMDELERMLDLDLAVWRRAAAEKP
jgi:hypothetical protein